MGRFTGSKLFLRAANEKMVIEIHFPSRVVLDVAVVLNSLMIREFKQTIVLMNKTMKLHVPNTIWLVSPPSSAKQRREMSISQVKVARTVLSSRFP